MSGESQVVMVNQLMEQHHYVTHEDDMAGIVLEQAAKLEDRRCPVGAARQVTRKRG